MNASKKSYLMPKFKYTVILLFFALCTFACAAICIAQPKNSTEIDYTLDLDSDEFVTLPKIFFPDIDLSGRGFSRQSIWPQELCAQKVLETWGEDIGFKGLFRLQYNLWDINEFSKNKNLQDKQISNYDDVLQRITDAGGTALVTIFGTPAGLGRVLDKRSPPKNIKAFKELVKEHIRYLSCQKNYNIWYEVWSAPDLDDFFLGKSPEYLYIYRAVAQAIMELEEETGKNIPVGGPSTSWWFQNVNGNSIITPERSLIYQLIKFCYQYHLPLDFISWHAYSTDPKCEKELTSYKKTPEKLIRAWLSYFRFKPDVPLIVDEWNYDSGANLLPARGQKAEVGASYIPARLEDMYEAGIDYHTYFSMEDFKGNKENVISNVGAFWFDSDSAGYKGYPKSIYNVFRMIASLEKKLFIKPDLEDEFVGVISTEDKGRIVIIIYNYIDPDIALNFLSRSIATLQGGERKILARQVKSGELSKILSDEEEFKRLRARKRVKALLGDARRLRKSAEIFRVTPRELKLNLKNLRGTYLKQRYIVDSSCTLNCQFAPVEAKQVDIKKSYQETIILEPYSVNMLIFQPETPEPAPPPAQEKSQDDSRKEPGT